MNESKKEIELYLEKSLVDELKKLAKDQGMTFSEFANVILTAHLKTGKNKSNEQNL